jgi:stage II sporulation protein R
MLQACDSLESAEQASRRLLPEIERMSRELARRFDYNAEITAEITKMYFTTRVYENMTLPAGNYTALRITVGEGRGENWWCVMFPLLCVPAVSEQEAKTAINLPESVTESPRVKFAVFELLSGLFR